MRRMRCPPPKVGRIVGPLRGDARATHLVNLPHGDPRAGPDVENQRSRATAAARGASLRRRRGQQEVLRNRVRLDGPGGEQQRRPARERREGPLTGEGGGSRGLGGGGRGRGAAAPGRGTEHHDERLYSFLCGIFCSLCERLLLLPSRSAPRERNARLSRAAIFFRLFHRRPRKKGSAEASVKSTLGAGVRHPRRCRTRCATVDAGTARACTAPAPVPYLACYSRCWHRASV
jgi:hypothetical protein